MTENLLPLRILIVDDDTFLRETLAGVLQRGGYAVLEAGDGARAMEIYARADILLLDIRLPDTNGIDLLTRVREARPDLPAIVMTGYGTIKDAVEAMRKGAVTYLAKPFEAEEILLHLREVEEKVRLRKAAMRAGRGDLIGAGRAMRAAYEAIDVAVASQAPVMITGETGTGKELAARAIHALSGRSRAPFVAVNLGAVPNDLGESELFGHEAGAFTGAVRAKPGRFALAGDGTLLLDEVGALPPALQVKLLRAIETREFWPVGADRPQTFRGRILAATNSDLDSAVASGAFRPDLFYRLAVLRIHMPALREHPEDIPAIAGALLERLRPASEDTGNGLGLTPQSLAAMVTYSWPGNVRELLNALEKGAAKVRASARVPALITPEDLELAEDTVALKLSFREERQKAADAWTRKVIAAALAASGGNVTHAAKSLKMHPNALFRLTRKYGLK